jgi:hypothetical protein
VTTHALALGELGKLREKAGDSVVLAQCVGKVLAQHLSNMQRQKGKEVQVVGRWRQAVSLGTQGSGNGALEPLFQRFKLFGEDRTLTLTLKLKYILNQNLSVVDAIPPLTLPNDVGCYQENRCFESKFRRHSEIRVGIILIIS